VKEVTLPAGQRPAVALNSKIGAVVICAENFIDDGRASPTEAIKASAHATIVHPAVRSRKVGPPLLSECRAGSLAHQLREFKSRGRRAAGPWKGPARRSAPRRRAELTHRTRGAIRREGGSSSSSGTSVR